MRQKLGSLIPNKPNTHLHYVTQFFNIYNFVIPHTSKLVIEFYSFQNIFAKSKDLTVNSMKHTWIARGWHGSMRAKLWVSSEESQWYVNVLTLHKILSFKQVNRL